MKKKITYLSLFIASIVGRQKVQAQLDPHFSQYYISPMTLNPAFTGVMEGDYRGSVIFRSQYGNTLLSKGLSADMTTNSNYNVGIDLLNESTADHSYSYNAGHINLAYTGVRLGPGAYHCISMAMQFGLISRRFDVSKLQFGDQWVSGLGYQETASSGETIVKPTVSVFDAGVGIGYYDASPNKKANFFGGIGVFHLSHSGNTFLTGDEDKLPVRYSVHAGARITCSDLFSIIPNALYMQEGNAKEKMLGAYAQLYVDENADFLFGANWRVADAFSPFAGFYYNGLTVGVSYDVTASSATGADTRTGSFELSISYVGKTKRIIKTKPFHCPRF